LRKVLQRPAGKKKQNGGVKPFQNLCLKELEDECQAHGLPFPAGARKNELQEILKEEMGGIQRVPAMMFFDQDSSLEAINLGKNN